MTLRRLLLGLACVPLLAACGETATDRETGAGPVSSSAAVETVPPEPETYTELPGPPPVTVRFGDESVAFQAFSYCYRIGCVDGMAPADPPDVGSPEEVIVEFPLPDWSFTASFQPAGERCGRLQEAPIERIGDGRFLLRPAGHAGMYDVWLSGRGDGDLSTMFRWVTPVDGPLPVPTARIAVVTDVDGGFGSYGVELELANLARTPKQASARITVTASDGAELTFDARHSREDCFPEGTVYFDAPDAKGVAAAGLGEGPFTYRVEVVLDGSRHVAEAVWPADEIRGNEPSVALEFSPRLPALD